MDALIIGAGIAGPATAMALQRAGITATVVYAYPRGDGEVGSVFTLSPNGLDALAAIDALDVARSIGFPTRTNRMRDANGALLGEIPLGQPLADGTSALTMKRSRLALALADEATRRGVTVIHGRRLVDATTTPDGVEARFDDGSTMTADLLIGADGVHSVVRRAIDAAAPTGRYVGLTNFGGITLAADVPASARELAPEAWDFIFGRQAFFGATPAPNGDVVWFVNDPRPEISAEERATTTLETWQARLAERFDDDPVPAAALIRTGRLELAADNTYDLGHVPTWHRGRMLVIGDAAHAPAPSSGQGASMALEDGVLLAMALRDEPSIEGAFSAFESARRARVERIVAHGARSSSSKTPGRIGRAVQGLFMRVVFRYLITERSVAWMYDHRIDWDRPLGRA
jgi:2-polyprenyl-6-methoxyphenol hydroxylase-like FAD-dependent oxidoreductase